MTTNSFLVRKEERRKKKFGTHQSYLSPFPFNQDISCPYKHALVIMAYFFY